jgi:hypothetical protein
LIGYINVGDLCLRPTQQKNVVLPTVAKTWYIYFATAIYIERGGEVGVIGVKIEWGEETMERNSEREGRRASVADTKRWGWLGLVWRRRSICVYIWMRLFRGQGGFHVCIWRVDSMGFLPFVFLKG